MNSTQMTTLQPEQFLTVQQVAAMLSISVRMARNLVCQPQFPQRLVFGTQTHRWAASEVAQWALQQRQPPVVLVVPHE